MDILIEVVKAVFIAVPLGIFAVALWLGFCVILQKATRSNAERIALDQFKIDHPDIRPGFTVKQRDGDLDIIMIAYGSTRPPRRKYYAVVRNEVAREIEDDSKYRPLMDR